MTITIMLEFQWRRKIKYIQNTLTAKHGSAAQDYMVTAIMKSTETHVVELSNPDKLKPWKLGWRIRVCGTASLQSDSPLTPMGLRFGSGGKDILWRTLTSLIPQEVQFILSHIYLQGTSHLKQKLFQAALRSYRKHIFGQCYTTTEAEEHRWQQKLGGIWLR